MADLSVKLKTLADSASFQQSLQQLEKTASPITVKISTDGDGEITRFQKTLTATSQIITKVNGDVQTTVETFKDFDNYGVRATQSLEDFNNKLQIMQINGSISNDMMEVLSKNATELYDSFAKGDISIEQFNVGMKALKNNTSLASAQFRKQQQELEKQAQASNKAAAESEKLAAAQNKLASKVEANLRKSSDTVDSFNSRLKKAKIQGNITSEQFEDFSNKMNDLAQKLKNGDISVEQFNTGTKQLNEGLSETITTTKAAGQSITDIIAKFTQWYIVSGLVTGALNLLKKAVSNVFDLDKALVEVSKVSDLTESQLEGVKQRAFDIGEEIGRTGTDVLNAAATFKKAGYTMEEALDLSKTALIMTNVADGIDNVEDAASSLISIMRGFKMEASDSNYVLDVLNHTSNNFAVDAVDLTEIMERVSGTIAQTGTSFEELTGLATAAFSTLRDSEKVASGINMISQRMRGMTEAGEENAELIPKIEEALQKYTGGAVSMIDKETGGLRSTYDVLQDLAGVYGTLDDNAKAYLNEVIAGNRQNTVLVSIMEAWDDVENVVAETANSVGSANEENQKYMNSLAGLKEQLKTSFEELSASLIESGLIEDILNFLKGLLNFIKNLNLRLSDLLIILGGIYATVSLLKGNVLGAVIGVVGVVAGVTMSLTRAIKGTTEATDDFTESTKESNKTTEKTTKELSDYEKELNKLKKSLSSNNLELKNSIELAKQQNEEKKKEKDLNDKLLAVEKARQELAEAKTKRARVFRAGVGFVYEADTSDVQSAQENLQSAIDELGEYKYELALERAESFVEKFNEILSGGDMLTGWKDLFDEFSDLLDSEFGSYIIKAKEFLKTFDINVSGKGIQSDIGHNASGTTNWNGGLTEVGENGPEIVNLPKGSEILSHSRSMKLTNLVDNPNKYLSGGKSVTLQFNGPLNFPNVRDESSANGFVTALLEMGNSKIAY